MIKSTEHDKLSDLQKQLLETIENNHEYLNPSCEAYEKNFIPHLTIGRNLSKEKFDCAISELPENITIRAEISKVVLTIVRDKSASERNDPDNLSVYCL